MRESNERTTMRIGTAREKHAGRARVIERAKYLYSSIIVGEDVERERLLVLVDVIDGLSCALHRNEPQNRTEGLLCQTRRAKADLHYRRINCSLFDVVLSSCHHLLETRPGEREKQRKGEL